MARAYSHRVILQRFSAEGMSLCQTGNIAPDGANWVEKAPLRRVLPCMIAACLSEKRLVSGLNCRISLFQVLYFRSRMLYFPVPDAVFFNFMHHIPVFPMLYSGFCVNAGLRAFAR